MAVYVDHSDKNVSTDEVCETTINELLCFVQNKIDIVPFDMLAKLCADFYSLEEISKSKDLMYQLNRQVIQERFKRHTGPIYRSLKDLKNILQWMFQMRLPYKHRFVAQDLSDISPVSMLNFDSSKILHETESIKTEYKALALNQKDMAKQIVDLKLAQHKHTRNDTLTAATSVLNSRYTS